MSGEILQSDNYPYRALLCVTLITMLGSCVVNPVTGVREVRLVSDQSANAMGAQQYGPSQQMQGGLLRIDQDLQAYVTRVGSRLAVASGVDLPYEFVVLNNSSLNAWALPGGKIALNRGLLMSMRNEAELAAVLAHEVAHAAAGHGIQRYQRGLLTEGLLSLAAIGLDVSGVAGGNQVVGAAQQGAQLIGLKYSRDAEREADYYGADFMVKAGYDPYAAVTLQEQFLALSNDQGQQGVASWFASHPTSAERVQNN
jgi:predicted Zn-dependent protease